MKDRKNTPSAQSVRDSDIVTDDIVTEYARHITIDVPMQWLHHVLLKSDELGSWINHHAEVEFALFHTDFGYQTPTLYPATEPESTTPDFEDYFVSEDEDTEEEDTARYTRIMLHPYPGTNPERTKALPSYLVEKAEKARELHTQVTSS